LCICPVWEGDELQQKKKKDMSFIKSDKSSTTVVGGERDLMGQVDENGHLEDENERTLL
jgi:hypothetical protein